jgi:hypothetical protein
MGGYKPRVLAVEQQRILLRLQQCPHLTVRGLAVELAERGYRVSPNMATLRHDRIDAPCEFDGPVNGQLFKAYVKQHLVLTLTLAPGDIICRF